MPHVFDRIHFLAPATSVAPLLVAGAVVARESLNHRGIMAVLVAGFLLVFSPILAHATIRAARVRRHGDWKLQPDEKARQP
jgi:multisubunit Na+/H+ antiporter MnhG subunit